jgi:hypothetical protein
MLRHPWLKQFACRIAFQNIDVSLVRGGRQAIHIDPSVGGTVPTGHDTYITTSRHKRHKVKQNQ